MKAIVRENYGSPDVLQLKEIEKPVPKENEVLVKVIATTVTAADCMVRKADTIAGRLVMGLRKPKKRYQIIGIELSGIIEAVGKNVTRFVAGDEIFGFSGFDGGTYAEYICLPENSSIDIKPEELSFSQSAAIVDGVTTAQFFLNKRTKVKAGEKVLIIGASGSIGTAAVQLAKYYGAEVTGVCSGANSDLVKSLGADHVIDYTKEDFTENGEKYDIIFDTVGKSRFTVCKPSLTEYGKYLITTGNLLNMWFLHIWTKLFSRKRLIAGMSVEKKDLLKSLKELVSEGRISVVIDRSYPLENISQAHTYVEKGHKKGNVVINIVETE